VVVLVKEVRDSAAQVLIELDTYVRKTKMPRAPQTWLLTDTHFNDENMLKFRPKNYEQLIIKRCRSLIAPQDTLIHLGDVIFSRPGELKDYLSLIPGKTKILVRGNHDKAKDSWFLGQGFAFVADAIKLGQVYLTHEPMLLPPKQTIINGATVNVHGHFHTFGFRTELEKLLYNPDFNKLLALELTNYAPVPLQSFVPNLEETPNQSAGVAGEDTPTTPQGT